MSSRCNVRVVTTRLSRGLGVSYVHPLVPGALREARQLCQQPTPSSAQWMGQQRQTQPLQTCSARAHHPPAEIRKRGRKLPGGVGRETMVQEILRHQMRLKGESKMGVKAEGYIIAVKELKCTLCLISLTALILFKFGNHLGKPSAPPFRDFRDHFYQDDQGHQEGKFGSKMYAFLKAPQSD